MLCSSGKHEAGLTRGQMGLYGIEVMLVLFDFDGDGHNIVIELAVMHDLPCQPPVVGVSHSLLEYLQLPPGPVSICWNQGGRVSRGKGLEG
jgi:hypothetical protein